MMAVALRNEDISGYEDSPNSCSMLIFTHHSNLDKLSTILKTERHKIMTDRRIFKSKHCI